MRNKTDHGDTEKRSGDPVIARDRVIGKDENLITDRHRYHESGAGNLADQRLGHSRFEIGSTPKGRRRHREKPKSMSTGERRKRSEGTGDRLIARDRVTGKARRRAADLAQMSAGQEIRSFVSGKALVKSQLSFLSVL